MFALVVLFVASALVASTLAQPFTACGIDSDIAFTTWSGGLSTSFPLVFPKTETELAQLVKSVSKIPGCKIRVAGTGGSSDGVVALKQDPQVVIVNLAEMEVHPSWDNKLDVTTSTVRVGAGKSLTDLTAFVRPLGYLSITRPYGRMFTVGGFYLNPSTHGSTLEADRAAKYVTGIRALLANGKYVEIKDKKTLAGWRGSMGLLGIVVALEVSVRKDTGIVQTLQQKTFAPGGFNQSALETFLNQNVYGAESTMWFYNILEDRLNALVTYASADPTFNYSQTASYYATQKALFPDMSKFGVPTYTPEFIQGMLPPGLQPIQIAGAVMQIAEQTITQGWLASNVFGRDGYVHMQDKLFKVNLLGDAIKCPTDCINDGTMFEVFTLIRNQFGAAITFPIASEFWLPTFMPSFRIFTVSKTPAMVLDGLKPGKYLAIDIDDAKGIFSKSGFSFVFRRIEAALDTLGLGRKPHLGKDYGFDVLTCSEGFAPFQDGKFIDSVYPEQVKEKFAKKMEKYDPKGLFRAGSVPRLLGLGERAFDPRGLVGDACTSNSDCATGGCCCLFTPTCAQFTFLNKCVPCSSPLL